MTTVLMTGFEPFGGAAVNASWEAVRQVSAPPGVDLRVRLLPCRFGAALDELWRAVEREDPAVVIAVGVADGRPDVSLERVAVNLDDAPIPDNAGAQPVDRPIVADGPAAYLATLPVKACAAAVRALGVPVGLSHSAGTFVCNHVFYGLMHRAATLRPGLRAGFVHVPHHATLPPETAAAALATIAGAAVRVRADLTSAEGALH